MLDLTHQLGLLYIKRFFFHILHFIKIGREDIRDFMRKTTQQLSCIKYKLQSDLSWIIIQKFLVFSQSFKPGISFTFALDI